MNVLQIGDVFSNETLINGLPNEVSLQCFSYLTSKEAATASRVCKVWHKALINDMFLYKYHLIAIHFQIFQYMTSTFPEQKYCLSLIKKMHEKIESNEICNEFIPSAEQFKELASKKMKSGLANAIESGVKFVKRITKRKKERKHIYAEMLIMMRKIALSNQIFLFLFEHPIERGNRFQQNAIMHLPSLKNIIYTSEPALSQHMESVSFIKISHLFISRAVCNNFLALESLEKIMPRMHKLKSVTLSASNLIKENDQDPALDNISKILVKMPNLRYLTIKQFQMNDRDAEILALLINDLKGLISCTLEDEGDITDPGLIKIVEALNEKTNRLFFRFRFTHRNSPAIQEGLKALRTFHIDLDDRRQNFQLEITEF